MKRYLHSRYFVHYETKTKRCSQIIPYRQASLTGDVITEIANHIKDMYGEDAFIVNISKVS